MQRFCEQEHSFEIPLKDQGRRVLLHPLGQWPRKPILSRAKGIVQDTALRQGRGVFVRAYVCV